MAAEAVRDARSGADNDLIAITHRPTEALQRCQLTHLEREAIDLTLAVRQHAAYEQVLRECGASVQTLDVNGHLPDCVFVEDTALVFDETAILTSPGALARRPEVSGIAPYVAQYRTTRRIELPGTLDGGDVFVVGHNVFVGQSSRTNRHGAEQLQQLLAAFGYHVRAVPVTECLHLKSAVTPLPDGSLLVNPLWVHEKYLEGYTLHSVDPAEPFAGDVLSIGDCVVCAAENPRTAQKLRSLGFDVRTTELSEFAKAEGGVTCLSLVFRRGAAATS